MSSGPEDTQSETEWADCLPPSPALGAPVQTACGGVVQYCATTPCAVLHGRQIFFCLAVCKVDFDRDPQNSCLSMGTFRSIR